ncbi:hypothetical protein [Nonomuraea sp. NPDC049784]|uniref:hypothetical protein n=1 Tax=Nonomuraea sp. NPDC049784 TaxID=3154361 RepID=UPI0033FC9EF5
MKHTPAALRADLLLTLAVRLLHPLAMTGVNQTLRFLGEPPMNVPTLTLAHDGKA